MNEHIDRKINECIDRKINDRTEGRKDGRTDGRTQARMNRLKYRNEDRQTDEHDTKLDLVALRAVVTPPNIE